MCEQTTAERQQFLTGMGAVGNSCHSWLIQSSSRTAHLYAKCLYCSPAVPTAKQCSQSFLLSPAISGPPENTSEPALRMRTRVHQQGKITVPSFPFRVKEKRSNVYPACTTKTTRAAVRNKDFVFSASAWFLKL